MLAIQPHSSNTFDTFQCDLRTDTVGDNLSYKFCNLNFGTENLSEFQSGRRACVTQISRVCYWKACNNFSERVTLAIWITIS